MTDTGEPVMDTPISNNICTVCLMQGKAHGFSCHVSMLPVVGIAGLRYKNLDSHAPFAVQTSVSHFRYSLLNLHNIFIR